MKTSRRPLLDSILNPAGLSATIRDMERRTQRIERAPVKFDFNKPNPLKKAPQPLPPQGGTAHPRSVAFSGDICGVAYDAGGGGVSQLELGSFFDATTPTDATISSTALYWVAALFLKWEGADEPDIDWAVTGAVSGASLINSLSVSDHAKVYVYRLDVIPSGVGRVKALFTVSGDPFDVNYAGMITFAADDITSSTQVPAGDLQEVELHDMSAVTSHSITRPFGTYVYYGFFFAANTDFVGFRVDPDNVVDPDGTVSDVGIADRYGNVGTAAVPNFEDYTYEGSWNWTNDPHQAVFGLIKLAHG